MNLLGTLLRSVRLHGPLGVHPTGRKEFLAYFLFEHSLLFWGENSVFASVTPAIFVDFRGVGGKAPGLVFGGRMQNRHFCSSRPPAFGKVQNTVFQTHRFTTPKNLFGLFLTFRVISILQGYFLRPSENTL